MRCLLLFILCNVAFAQPLDPKAQAFLELRFESAKLAEERSDFAQAEQDYKLILARYPREIPEVYQNLGLVYYLQKKYSEAAATLEAGLKLKPTMLGARLFLGSAYVSLGQSATALPHLEMAHRRKPTLESSTYLGLANVALRRYEAAVPHLRRALELAEEKPGYLYLTGEAYLKLSEQVANTLSLAHPGSEYDQFITARILDGQEFYQVAARHYLLSARKDPFNASVFFYLARGLAAMGLEEPSRLALERYRQLMPFDERAGLDPVVLPKKDIAEVGLKVDYAADLRGLPTVENAESPPLGLLPSSANQILRKRVLTAPAWRKAVELLAKGRWTEALKQLDLVPPTSRDWLHSYLRALAYFWMDDYAAAERIVSKQSFKTTQQPAAALLRWQVYHQLSLSHFQRLLDEYPNSSRAHFVKARILHAQGKKEALDEYQAAIAAGPQELGIHTALADYLLSNSKYQDAIQACKGELELDPYSLEAKGTLGRIHTQLRQPAEAMPYLEAVLASDPKHAEARSDYARCFELKGDLNRALSEYQRALADDPSLNRLHYVLARLYRRTGRPELAQKEFEIFRQHEASERARGRELREEQLQQ